MDMCVVIGGREVKRKMKEGEGKKLEGRKRGGVMLKEREIREGEKWKGEKKSSAICQRRGRYRMHLEVRGKNIRGRKGGTDTEREIRKALGREEEKYGRGRKEERAFM